MGKPLSLFWKCQIGGWAAFVILSLPVKIVVFGSLSAAVVSLYRDGIGFLLTWGMYKLYSRVSYRRIPVLHVILLIILLSFLGSGIEMLVSQALHRVVPFEEAGFASDTVAIGVLYYRVALFACWSLLYFGLRLVYESMEKDGRLVRAVADHREVELQMLRAQMNPHFLFNALNTIRSGVDKSDLRTIIQSLADYLRFSLDHGSDDLVPLGMEYDAMRDYLHVVKSRFQDALEIDCRIDESVRSVPVPGIILQPLVENAVKYGQETSDPPLRVRVDVSRVDAATVQILVGNSGRWTAPKESEKSGHLGLENIRRRLALLYADKHRFEVAGDNGWVTVNIRIPAA